jgi:hypothetical protein
MSDSCKIDEDGTIWLGATPEALALVAKLHELQARIDAEKHDDIESPE